MSLEHPESAVLQGRGDQTSDDLGASGSISFSGPPSALMDAKCYLMMVYMCAMDAAVAGYRGLTIR